MLSVSLPQDSKRPENATRRPRDLGIRIGELAPGEHNAITDVAGVRVGHTSVVRGDSVRTGVTVVLPHGENVYQSKLPAALAVGNGFGKLVGATQLMELGELESAIALTNTLNVGKVADALVAWMLEREGNEGVRSINVVVGETNDGRLNDIRGRHVEAEHVRAALRDAAPGIVRAGSVGAGTGTRCFGFKGGIGTSSRIAGQYTLGVLVQTNFGGTLRIDGRRVPESLLYGERQKRRDEEHEHDDDTPGSCMIVIATDAPLDAHRLQRLAKRAFVGMARVGASFSNGSGDYAIAFSTAAECRIPQRSPGVDTVGAPVLRNDRMTPLFVAAADATEEAILDSLFRAQTVTSKFGRVEALPLERIERWLGGK